MAHSAEPIHDDRHADAHDDAHDDDARADLLAAAMLLAGKRVAVLTGAGISTESGIPDYRGPETAKRARRPMRFVEFTSGEHARRRYWARATVGWPRVRDAVPNDAHRAIALGQAHVVGVITQNVDGLHAKAGSGDVVELHGALRDVVCLRCGAICAREHVHARTLAKNPALAAIAERAKSPAGALASSAAQVAPDGDTDLDDDVIAAFRVVDCEQCGGPLKPRVVFFGENVPAVDVDQAWRTLDRADALLVVGSSLEVFSGRRFVEEAHRRRMPIAIVNATATRSDQLATVVVRGRAGDVVPQLFPPLFAR